MRAMSVQIEKVTPFERIYDVLESVAKGMGYIVQHQPTGNIIMSFQAGEFCLNYSDVISALLDWYEMLQLQQKEHGWWKSEIDFIESYLLPNTY